MIVVLKRDSGPAEQESVRGRLADSGLEARPVAERMPRLLEVEGTGVDAALEARLRELPEVEGLVREAVRHPLVSRELQPETSLVRVERPGFEPVVFGTSEVPVMAGPCSVESWPQLLETAQATRDAGARLLRGGAWKPRTSPYSFQGLGPEGLELLVRARDETGLLIVTEALDRESLDLVAEHADLVQIGTRNMSNFPLLQAAGRCGKPVLLKRGFSSTLEEWLLAAEYLLANGNDQVILCERGVRTFGDHARFVMDLNIIPAAQSITHLPVAADPSHGTGRSDCVVPLARAAVAVGCDGLMLEVHPRPAEALSDGPQALLPSRLTPLIRQLDQVAAALGRSTLAGSRRRAAEG